jgi:hypothetical protein
MSQLLDQIYKGEITLEGAEAKLLARSRCIYDLTLNPEARKQIKADFEAQVVDVFLTIRELKEKVDHEEDG